MSEFGNPIIEAIAMTNMKVVAEAPAMAMAFNYMNAAHANGIMYHNSVHSQHNQFQLSLSGTTQGVIQVYSSDTLANAASIADMITRTP